MNWKRTSVIWTLCKVSYSIGLIFWIIETVYFLIADGWHWYAINNNEIICDNIVKWFCGIGAVLFLYVVFDVIDNMIPRQKK